MKELNLPNIPIKRINVLDYEKNVSIKMDPNLLSILKDISPLKAELRRRKNSRLLSLMLQPNMPFGPDPDILRELLFKELNYNFNRILLEAAEGYGMQRIEVFGSNSGGAGLEKRVIYRKKGAKPKKDSVIINLIELYSLYKAVKEKSIDKMVCISFFADYDNSYSFLTAPGTKLSDIVEGFPKLKELLRLDGAPGELRIYHPVSGRKVDLQNDLASEENSIIFIEWIAGPQDAGLRGSEAEGLNRKSRGPKSAALSVARKRAFPKGFGKLKTFVFKPAGRGLFPFPFFNRRIDFAEIRRCIPRGSGTEMSPCINCLACVDYCPAELHPSYLYHLITRENIDEAAKLGLKACILCGKCSFVCPSSIPLSETFKAAIKELEESEGLDGTV
ncbi:MAG: 4Fe-4S dicluster domain-containing protein [Spirochaetales bacterium]|nr:4Fe-4S dicluster domain-containing protein [Spirochaetales bacterium]